MAIFLAAMWNEMSFLNWFFCQPIGSVWNGTDRIGSDLSDLGSLNQQTRLDLPTAENGDHHPLLRFVFRNGTVLVCSEEPVFLLTFAQNTHRTLENQTTQPPINITKFKALFLSFDDQEFSLKRGSRLWRHFLCAKRSSKWKGRQLWSNICRQDDGKWRENTYTHNTIRRTWREGGSAYFT